MLTAEEFAELVHDVAQRHAIPGLSAAFDRGGEVHRAASGVLNVTTQAGVGDDSVFQIGSVTKVLTGTLVMQLVDEGRIELDAPLRRYLPDLRLAGEPASDAVTIRRLLAHASGIVGDVFLDTGRNDDALALYAERCGDLPFLTEPGAYFSYCNSGYNLLGRAIEVVTGEPWARRLRGRLLAPLGIVAAVDAEEAVRLGTAVGHVVDADGQTALTPTTYLPRSGDPAGSRLAMSPSSLLAFARMHLRDGVAPDGTRLLEAATARAMRELVIPLPVDIAGPSGYGLSWQVYDAWRPRAVGHDGATIGQSAFLRLLPEWDVAVAMLANSGSGPSGKAFDELLRAVLGALGEAHIPTKPVADLNLTFDAARYAGIYQTYMSHIVVNANGGGALTATVSMRNNESIGDLPDYQLVLTPIDEGRFLAEDRLHGSTSVVGFAGFGNDDKPRFLFTGFRLAERVDG